MGVFYITIPAVMTVSYNSPLTVQVITFNSSDISAVPRSIETSHQGNMTTKEQRKKKNPK